MSTVLDSQGDYLPQAVEVLRRGGLVISPTTTNYNVICDATNALAVERVFKVKRRVKLGPLPVCLPHPDDAEHYVHFPEGFDRSILSELLPGEICFVFWQKYPFPDQLTCGLRSVAISCSTHPVFSSMVVAMNRPVAATSANVSGQGDIFVSLSKAIADIGSEVDLIIDAGPTPAQQAVGANRSNTIIDLTFGNPYLVRPGWVGLEKVRRYFPSLRTDVTEYRELLARRAGKESNA